jgi:very-short-patch-repair endonuclease
MTKENEENQRLENRFLEYWNEHCPECPQPVRQYRFHETRNFAFDFAWPEYKVAVEIEGGLFSRFSRHRSSVGYHNDCDKYNEATRLGWKLIRFTTKHIQAGKGADGHPIEPSDLIELILDCVKETSQ